MRPLDFAYSGLLHRQGGGGGAGAGVPIGGLHMSLAAPVIGGQTYELATAYPAASFTYAGNAALAVISGKVTGGAILPNPVTAAVALMQASCVWNGAIYGVTAAAGGAVKKRASGLAAYGAALWSVTDVASASRQRLVPVANSTRMLHCHYSNDFTQAYAITCRSDVARSTSIFTGNGVYGEDPDFYATGAQIWRALEVAPNIILGLTFVSNVPIVGFDLNRTTNDGATWARISGNLSTPAVRLWCAAWLGTGANIHMLAHSGAIATSTDLGVNWTVNTAVPNSANTMIWQSVSGTLPQQSNHYDPNAVVDLVSRKGLILTTAGQIKSFNLDTPTTGYVNETAVGFFTGNCALFQTSKAWFVLSATGGARPGLWYALKPDATVWRQAATVARLPASSPNEFMPGIGSELGDGQITLDLHGVGVGAAANPSAIQIADLNTKFDRYTVADPLLPTGLKPYVRVS